MLRSSRLTLTSEQLGLQKNPSLATWSVNLKEDSELYCDRRNGFFHKATPEDLLRVSALYRHRAVRAQAMVISLVDIIRTAVHNARIFVALVDAVVLANIIVPLHGDL